MTKFHIRHIFCAGFIRVKVQKGRTKMKLLENSKVLHKGRLHKKTAENSVNDYSLAGSMSFLESSSSVE